MPGTVPALESHVIVVPLPQRDDGKVWDGTITWISTKPIELGYRLKHDSSTVNMINDTLYILSPSVGNTTYTIPQSLWQYATNILCLIRNFCCGYYIFHRLNNTNFIVTYIVILLPNLRLNNMVNSQLFF
jgi:hypothetical protein